MNNLIAKSYAKINLGLEILAKRPDGYHEIITILQAISLHDTISFTLTQSEITVECDNPLVPNDENNLVFRAATLMKSKLNIPFGAKIKIIKNIPIGAGLGGGSSNAATTLLALNRLWQLKLDYTTVFNFAKSLGADVPFFLKPGTALATNKGDKLTYYLSVPKMWLVLVYPKISISTAWAYNNLKIELTKHATYIKIIENGIITGNLKLIASYLHNSFEKEMIKKYPVIAKIKQKLISYGALGTLMSGSGSVVFGLVGSEAHAKKLRKKIVDPRYDTWIAYTVNPINYIQEKESTTDAS